MLGKLPSVSLERAINAWLDEAFTGRKSEDETRSHANAVIALLQPGERFEDIQAVADRVRASTREKDGERVPLANATRNRRLAVLKAVAKWAWRKKGWSAENLSARIDMLPERGYQRREVTPEDARRLIQHAKGPRAKALIALSAYTGMRLGEVLALTKDSIRGDVLLLRDTKNGTDRVVPILPELRPHLVQIPFDANWRNVYRGFERARKAAGLSIRYHDLRHMVGTALHEAGADQRRIMAVLGHRSIQTSARYVHPSTEANRRALARALKRATAPSESHQARGKGSKKAA